MNARALLNKNVLQFLGWKGKLSLFCSEWNGVISRGKIKWVTFKLSLNPGTVISHPGSRFDVIILLFLLLDFLGNILMQQNLQKHLSAFGFCARSFFLFSHFKWDVLLSNWFSVLGHRCLVYWCLVYFNSPQIKWHFPVKPDWVSCSSVNRVYCAFTCCIQGCVEIANTRKRLQLCCSLSAPVPL